MHKSLKKFLEGTKLTAETITALLPILKMLLIAAGAFALAMTINVGFIEDREQQYLANMRVYKNQAEAASRYADSLKIEELRHAQVAHVAQIRAAVLQRDADALKARTAALINNLDSLKETITDSTEMARIIIPAQDSVINQQTLTIGKQDTVIINLNKSLMYKDSSIMLITLSRDSLQQVVNNIPAPPKPPMFPKLSRKQVFVGGTIVGFLVKVFLFK